MTAPPTDERLYWLEDRARFCRAGCDASEATGELAAEIRRLRAAHPTAWTDPDTGTVYDLTAPLLAGAGRRRDGRCVVSPEPYWQDEDGRVRLYLGDCREIIPALGIAADSCVADPPYGETASAWDNWPDGWVGAVASALPASASLWCFGSARMFLDHHTDFAGWRLHQEALWVKRNGTGPGQSDRLVRIHEWAYHWYRGRWGDLHHEWQRERTTANQGTVRKASRAAAHQREGRATTWQDDGTRQPRSVTYVIDAPSVRFQRRHPDEKPLAVVAPLVRECTPPNGLVLDPFAGSGTVLAAAAMSGRRAIGIEGDERYAEKAAQRLQQGVLDLGGAA